MKVWRVGWRLAGPIVALLLLGFGTFAAEPTAVDASTIRGRVMCGYQGWFRCPGDGSDLGWIHWSGDPNRIAPDSLTFEMWPDMSEYGQDEQCAASGFTYPDGTPATLFSSAHPRTVLRHFQWMKEYGIDGAWLQHFLVDLPGAPNEGRYESRVKVLDAVREAATATGRTWALTFDMAAMPSDRIVETLVSEWKRQVDRGITKDACYLHEKGRPVVMVWGFYRNQNITPEIANKIIDFFKSDAVYGAFIAGGCEWEWRTESLPGWPEFLRRFDAISPWNVGNYTVDNEGRKWASTGYWREDIAEAQRVGMLYIPVVYPGFGWDNLKHLPAGKSQIPRQGGRFFWKQFHTIAESKLDMAYVAMFDEVDEGTAIFKVTSKPPVQAHFVGYEGLPSDWYLRLAGEGARMLRGERSISMEPPAQ